MILPTGSLYPDILTSERIVMLSQTTEYALRAIVYLGFTRGAPNTTADIARATKTPVGYLAKVMQGLSKAHLVESQRGLHGGFILAREPDAITMYDVVQAVDPIMRIKTCPMELEGHGDGLCLLHATLDQAMGQAEALFRATRISDLIRDSAAGSSRHPDGCSFPARPPVEV